MIFEIDKRTVTEGDVVQLNWQCLGAEKAELMGYEDYTSVSAPQSFLSKQLVPSVFDSTGLKVVPSSLWLSTSMARLSANVSPSG